jgi:sortase (surface protein transpeptidase)
MTYGTPGWDGMPARKRRDGSVQRHAAASGRGLGLLAALLILVIIGGGTAAWAYVGGRFGNRPAAAPAPSPAVSEPVAEPSAPAPSPASPTQPTEVRIPRIGVTSALVTLGLDATGKMTTPTDYALAGWYADGTVPGEMGPAVIAGHVDSTSGPAVFFRLKELVAGDVIEVAFGSRTVSFTVVGTARYPKDDFPTASVYGPTPDPQLRLITCGGVFSQARSGYLDNVVVYAAATA